MNRLIHVFVLFSIMFSVSIIPNVYADANTTKEANINLVIIEAESNPSGKDANNEWIKIFNPMSVDADINGMVIQSTHGRTESYSISQQTIINPCTSTTIILPGQFLDNKDESVILLDSNGEVVDKTLSFSDNGNDSLTWKTQIPSCVDKKEIQASKNIDEETHTTKSNDSTIPGWIKTNAGWWANDEIDDATFVSGIQYLIKEGIISVSSSSSSTNGGNMTSEIPGWIKNTTKFWTEGDVSDMEFINALQYMIKNGIIEIPNEDESPLDCLIISDDDSKTINTEKGDCYTDTISRIVDGDTIHDGLGNSIRLVLVDSPEMNTNEGKESKKYLESICPVGSTIHVDEDDNQLEGSYGRIIAKVYCDGMIDSLNQKIIENNHGTIYQRFCDVSEFGDEKWAVKYGC